MVEWWAALSDLQKVFGYVAIPATVVMLGQTLLVIFGGGDDGDFDADDMDVGGDGLALFSIRGIVAFFAVGGWTGLTLAKQASPFVSILFSLLAGAAALFVVALIFRAANRLQDSGNLSLQNAVGKTAKVYLTIPAEGRGKVNLTFQGRYVECDATTQDGQRIKTGSTVKVIGLADENTLIVTSIGVEEEIL